MANPTSMRGYLIEVIKPKLPTTWTFLASPYITDAVTRVTCSLELTRVERFSEAGQAVRRITYNLNVIQPTGRFVDAADAVDDALVLLLDALDDIEGLVWTVAEKGVTGQDQPAYAVSMTFTYSKPTPEPTKEK